MNEVLDSPHKALPLLLYLALAGSRGDDKSFERLTEPKGLEEKHAFKIHVSSLSVDGANWLIHDAVIGLGDDGDHEVQHHDCVKVAVNHPEYPKDFGHPGFRMGLTDIWIVIVPHLSVWGLYNKTERLDKSYIKLTYKYPKFIFDDPIH